jgi:hypothetical protein
MGDRLYVLIQLDRAKRLVESLEGFLETEDVDCLRLAQRALKSVSEGDSLQDRRSFIDVIIRELSKREGEECPEDA